MTVTYKYNDAITARPTIIFPANSKRPGRPIIREMGLGEMPLTRPVKEFTAAYMTAGTPQYKEIAERPRRVIAAIRLMQHARAKGPGAARELAEAFHVLSGGRDAGSLNHEMRGARLVMWRRKRGETPVPTIWTPDINTAAFVFAAFGGIEVCASCRQLFAPDPERDVVYCSEVCGQRFRQKLYRRRVKARAKGYKTSKRKEKS